MSPRNRRADRLARPAALSLAMLLLAGCSGGGSPTPSTAAPATVTVTMGATTPATGAPGGASATVVGTPGEVQVPVYYVAEALPRIGPRLYREFRQVALLPGGRVATAVNAMLTLPPLDPDYRSDWAAAAVTLRSVTTSGPVATVDLSRWLSLGAAAESMAVQQLVHTVTAADPAITSVRILVGGAVPSSGHLDLRGALTRARALDTLALVWILDPAQGASSGSPVTVRIYGTGFEGSIPLKVFRAGTEVTSTFVTTRMGELAEASTTIALSPGTYDLRAYNENMESGALEVWDSKTFTVR